MFDVTTRNVELNHITRGSLIQEVFQRSYLRNAISEFKQFLLNSFSGKFLMLMRSTLTCQDKVQSFHLRQVLRCDRNLFSDWRLYLNKINHATEY